MVELFRAISQLRDSYLMFPAFQSAYDQLRRNLQLYRETGCAQHLMILGESGAGKTTLATTFAQEHPKQVLAERDVLPVLYVSIPAAATIAATVEAILRELGDLIPTQGTVSAKTARAITLAKACTVEMVLLDEGQHIQDRGRDRTQYFVADWLKGFMDALAVPVCILGLPRTSVLLQVNEQLRRRFTRQFQLLIHPDRSPIDEQESLELFTSLANALPISISPYPYKWPELATRLHFATGSRIAYVKQLLVGALEQLDRSGGQAITVANLEQAFTEVIWAGGINQLNPFNTAYVFRPLDRPGEPFHKEGWERNVMPKREKS